MNFRLTGRFVATVDSILTSWVTDNRDPGNIHYDPKLIAQSGIAADKLPEIVSCTDVLGPLCYSAAKELGLAQETPVIAGAVDNSAAAIGSGAVRDHDAHLYVGTSSWIGVHVPFKKTDLSAQRMKELEAEDAKKKECRVPVEVNPIANGLPIEQTEVNPMPIQNEVLLSLWDMEDMSACDEGMDTLRKTLLKIS